MRDEVITATGSPLRDINTGADGLPIDWRANERAGILGTILFLEQVARWDTSEEFRKAARHQADFLRALVRRRSRDGKDTLDGALREALQKLMAPPPAQLPGKPLVIEMEGKA